MKKLGDIKQEERQTEKEKEKEQEHRDPSAQPCKYSLGVTWPPGPCVPVPDPISCSTLASLIIG